MSFKIVQQLTKVGRGEDAMLVPVPVKVIGNAPNEEGKPNADGDVPAFISIPPIVRLYIGRDVWGSPDVMPTFEEMKELPDDARPTVYTLTLNPRNGNFNLHAGLGKGTRIDVCPRTGAQRIEVLKPESGGAESMTRKLDAMFGGQRDASGFTLAGRIVGIMVAEMVALNEKIDEAREKRAAKGESKPRQPRKPVNKAKAKQEADDARLLAWAARRTA